jgi:hypothetical protein
MSAHSDLIRYILTTAKQHPFAGRILLKKNPSGKVKVGSRYIELGPPGWSDILGIQYQGKFVAIEVKARKADKLNPEQEAFRDMVLAFGGYYAEIRSEQQALDFLSKVCAINNS